MPGDADVPDLLAREQAPRAEAAPDALARLDQEKTALETHLASVTDEHIRRACGGPSSRSGPARLSP